MHYEAAWPVRKLALKCTPHAVQYLPDFRLYALATSAPVKWKEPEVGDDDVQTATLIKTRRAGGISPFQNSCLSPFHNSTEAAN